MSPSQSVISQWGWGFHTVWGGIDRWDLSFCRRFVTVKRLEGFIFRGWDLVLLGFGGTLTLARGVNLASRYVHEPQPISNHPVELGFPHRVGWYRSVGSPF